MSTSLGSIQTIKADVRKFLGVALDRHRRGDDPFRVVQGLSDSVDGVLKQLFSQEFEGHQELVALAAVGGFGRRELCPHSDIDLVFVREKDQATAPIERLVRLLWDGGFHLGHSVRTPAECLRFMIEDPVTAAALLEARYLTGSSRVWDRFQATALNRYRKSRGEAFASAKLAQLRDSIEGPGRTIYVLEPHIKDGPCCLRDIQRVLWIENIRRGKRALEELAQGGYFSIHHAERLRRAYSFYLRLRCELHFSNGLRQDILELDRLVEVSRNLGYRGTDREVGEQLMAEYYRHVRDVYRFLRHYVETGTQGTRFLTKLARKMFAAEVKPYLFAYRGTLFHKGETECENLAEEIADIFLIAQRQDLRLSESLCEWIRRSASDPALDFNHSTFVHRALVTILRGRKNTGRILKRMHETGVLGRIIPEFGQLNGLVNFDGHHQFTVDEHTLRALEELDRLENEEDGAGVADPDRAEFVDALRSIDDRLPLRLALLLHDVGKALPGNHAVSGSRSAVLICERLGLDESITDTVESLIYRHLELFNVSVVRDFTEPRVIRSLAHRVGDEERLRLLYVLTFVDVVSVGPGTWTAWKGAQLAEVYQRAMVCLRTGELPREDLEDSLATSGLSAEDREVVLDHAGLVSSPAYVRQTRPERMVQHARLATEFLSRRMTQVTHESFVGYHEVTICCRDRPRLFADLAGVLLSEGFNVLGAHILSRTDGVALDTFVVDVADGVHVGIPERVQKIRQKLQRVERRELMVADLVRQHSRQYRFHIRKAYRKPLYGASVQFDNESSEQCTIVEVQAGDRQGLLYDLATTISQLGLDIRMAKVSTLSSRARDVFYVVEADGQKIGNPARMKLAEQSLIAAANEPSETLRQGGVL